MNAKKTLGCLLLLIGAVAYAPMVTKEMAHNIFLKKQIYVLYIGEQTSARMWKQFSQFCEQGPPCAVINKNSEYYNLFMEKLSYTDSKSEIGYFAILDIQKQRKYVLPTSPSLTYEHIKQFYNDFKQGKLQQYLASEEPDPNPVTHCRKVVGKDLQAFLNSETPIKILLLQAGELMCDNCEQILKFYCELAQNMYDPNLLAFGHYDALKNDSPLIETERVPFFYIYCPGYPLFGINARQPEYLRNTIMDVMLRYTETGMREDTIILESSGIPFQPFEGPTVSIQAKRDKIEQPWQQWEEWEIEDEL